MRHLRRDWTRKVGDTVSDRDFGFGLGVIVAAAVMFIGWGIGNVLDGGDPCYEDAIYIVRDGYDTCLAYDDMPVRNQKELRVYE